MTRRDLEATGPSIAELRAIVESSPDAIFGETLDGKVTSWNRGAELLLGFTAQEMIGGEILRVIPPDRMGEQEHDRQRIAAGEALKPRETVFRNRDGKLIDVSVTASPFRQGDGKVVGAIHVVRDISRLKQTEKQFRLAVEAAPCAMLMIDAAGRIVLANSETERTFGWPRDELVGRRVESLVPERYRTSHARLRGAYAVTPRARPMESGLDLHALRKDGSEFPVEIGLNPVETPEGLYVIAAIVDITERKRSQLALEQRERELARSNRDLEEFARIASHDLQEPLRAVAGCVQILQRRFQASLDERAHELIAHAVDGANRMRTLIDGLLTYSRVGRKENSAPAVDCGEILLLALRNLSAAVQESGARVWHDSLPRVRADASEVLMLFQNTIGNAIKFRRPEEPPLIRIQAEAAPDDRWLLSVRDNGIGIAPEFHDRIFEVFQRLPTRREYPGTGIGLALCKRVVEHYGGRIWVESVPGEGTTFNFTLPRAE